MRMRRTTQMSIKVRECEMSLFLRMKVKFYELWTDRPRASPCFIEGRADGNSTIHEKPTALRAFGERFEDDAR